MLGIPAPMYHRYELGQIPKHEKLEVIALNCGVTIDWLLASSAAGVDTGAAPAVAEDRSHYPAQAPPGVCRYPAGCDLQTELADLRAEVSSMRGSIDTLLGLLGGPLRRAAGIEDGKDQRPAV